MLLKKLKLKKFKIKNLLLKKKQFFVIVNFVGYFCLIKCKISRTLGTCILGLCDFYIFRGNSVIYREIILSEG